MKKVVPFHAEIDLNGQLHDSEIHNKMDDTNQNILAKEVLDRIHPLEIDASKASVPDDSSS